MKLWCEVTWIDSFTLDFFTLIMSVNIHIIPALFWLCRTYAAPEIHIMSKLSTKILQIDEFFHSFLII